MSLKKDKNLEKWMKKMDSVLTWIIIWGVVGSMFWLATKTKKWQDVTKHVGKYTKKWVNKWVSLLWRWLAKIVSVLEKSKNNK